MFVRTGREVYVAWTIPSSGSGQTTYLLDLVESDYPNGRSGWNNEREVVLRIDGSVESKAPTDDNRYAEAEMFPDPIEAITSGAMLAITKEEFEGYWNAPVPIRQGGPGLMAKIRSLLRSAQ